MPELPEVETIVRKLKRGEAMGRGLPAYPSPIGHVVMSVWTDWPRAAFPSAEVVTHGLPGRRIESICRRGKYVVIALSVGHLLIHLKMSGRLDVVTTGAPRDKHVHYVFVLDNGYELRFDDARKFGRVYLVDDPDQVTGALGPEPLEASFTLRVFRQMMQRKSGALKPLLLDQTFIAGIGNIYADEALWRARLHPLRAANSLGPDQVAALYRGIRQALSEGIRHEGTAIDWVYPEGNYQDYLRVYGRAGRPCRRCHALIRRMVVGQRGTHFCPRCQAPQRVGSKRRRGAQK